MCNKEQLIGYVYGELSVFENAAFEAHLRECSDCRQEVSGLGLTRGHLATWAPPEPEFTYRVVKTARSDSAPPKRLGWMPQWGLAAAAALFLVAGAAAVSNLEVRYGDDGSITVRTGWRQVPQAPNDSASGGRPAAGGQAVAPAASSDQVMRQLAALERRVNELQAGPSTQAVRGDAVQRGVSVPELRRILLESEARQRAEMAVYVAQIWKDFNAMRASDLARVQQTLGQAQGLTNMQLRQQRDTIDSLRYLHAVSQQK